LGTNLLVSEAKVLRLNSLKSHVLGEYPKVLDAKIQTQLAELAVPVVDQDPRFLHI
jgi:hypothetical protein